MRNIKKSELECGENNSWLFEEICPRIVLEGVRKSKKIPYHDIFDVSKIRTTNTEVNIPVIKENLFHFRRPISKVLLAVIQINSIIIKSKTV
jgi:hypothetical protein